MNQKQIGGILIVVGLLLAIFVYVVQARENNTLKKIVREKGSCFLEDGTCLHETMSSPFYIIGWVLSSALVILALYLIFFDKTQMILAEQQIKVSTALKEAKNKEKEKDEFQAFLAGFSQEEQNILKAVKEQEGIKQSTLRYKTGMSKTALSLMLKSLEERGIISRKPDGKTNIVFLRKRV